MKIIAVIISLTWLPCTLLSWQPDAGFYFWRHQLTILSGAIGFAYMTAAMLLAMRLPWVEEYVHGLDKGYAIHKQMGIGGLIALLVHWLLIESARWLIALEVITRPERHARIGQSLSGINWTHWSKVVGECTFYVFLIFVVISLLQAVSYRRFQFVHKLAGAIFLAGAFHSVILLDYKLSAALINGLIWVCAVAGSLFAVISLSGNIGRSRKVTGQVIQARQVHEQSTHYRVLHLAVQLDSALNYRPGQFAYLDFADGEPPHPFSVLTYNSRTHIIQFAIKDLGDYTHHLFSHLPTGTAVIVEGGYGRFLLPTQQHQVWVGAGIGIVPFIAWLQAMSPGTASSARHIDLFYCRENEQQGYFVTLLEQMVRHLPNVNLSVFTASRGEYLCAEHIAKRLDLSQASVSFCGPAKFANSLKAQLITLGLAQRHFYSERFVLR